MTDTTPIIVLETSSYQIRLYKNDGDKFKTFDMYFPNIHHSILLDAQTVALIAVLKL